MCIGWVSLRYWAYHGQENPLPDSTTKHPVGPINPSDVANQGATFRPIYTERRPMMWAIDETALKSMSALGAEANRHFSFASFLVGCIVSIVISCASSTTALSPLGSALLNKGTYVLVFLVVVFYCLGCWAQHQKNYILDQIKRESDPIRTQQ
jgi:hypothetical protein